jgi:hypothetical protein
MRPCYRSTRYYSLHDLPRQPLSAETTIICRDSHDLPRKPTDKEENLGPHLPLARIYKPSKRYCTQSREGPGRCGPCAAAQQLGSCKSAISV